MSLFYKLTILMGAVVVASNYLVQFPIQKYGLEEILTYGAFSYPITFLITDLANRAYGKIVARKVVYVGFIVGIFLTLLVSTNFSEIISIRIAIGSGVGSITDTLLFFSIAFYKTGVPWVTLAIGDLIVKLSVTLIMLIPFRLLLFRIKDYTNTSDTRLKL